MNVQQTMEDVLRPAPTQWGVLRVPAQQDLHWLQMVALVLVGRVKRQSMRCSLSLSLYTVSSFITCDSNAVFLNR